MGPKSVRKEIICHQEGKDEALRRGRQGHDWAAPSLVERIEAEKARNDMEETPVQLNPATITEDLCLVCLELGDVHVGETEGSKQQKRRSSKGPAKPWTRWTSWRY